ncbi:CCN family member 1-like [Chanos chanos]|uniref:CCN family member 1 n=1 Tax=Chanos chanos TaxID=29144 RepID=A0A6J2VEM4_CHACN|nr:CCN family member 1-like [Chanos chanos]
MTQTNIPKRMERDSLLFSLVWLIHCFFLWSFLQVFTSQCPSECVCPEEPPRCPLGVSQVLDGCGCCKVCARQLNEDCSISEPCDHIKGLECNYGARFSAGHGICRAKLDGRPCEYNSRIYQNGETFQPNCKHQCTCIDGAVGCLPLCPQELSLPQMACANPRLVKVPGKCCEEWVCDWKGKPKSGKKQAEDDQSEDTLTNRNELVPIVMGGFKSLPAFREEPVVRMLDGGMRCISHTSPWSPCSATCGTGVSTRLSNNNKDCAMVEESRICEVRPCSQSPASNIKRGKKCIRVEKGEQPEKLTYNGCRSVKKYWPKYCGSCLDGRCCSPQETRTLPVQFRCEDGEMFTKNVMMIQTCKCDHNCPHSNPVFNQIFRLSNDIHKFTD